MGRYGSGCARQLPFAHGSHPPTQEYEITARARREAQAACAHEQAHKEHECKMHPPANGCGRSVRHAARSLKKRPGKLNENIRSGVALVAAKRAPTMAAPRRLFPSGARLHQRLRKFVQQLPKQLPWRLKLLKQLLRQPPQLPKLLQQLRRLLGQPADATSTAGQAASAADPVQQLLQRSPQLPKLLSQLIKHGSQLLKLLQHLLKLLRQQMPKMRKLVQQLPKLLQQSPKLRSCSGSR